MDSEREQKCDWWCFMRTDSEPHKLLMEVRGVKGHHMASELLLSLLLFYNNLLLLVTDDSSAAGVLIGCRWGSKCKESGLSTDAAAFRCCRKTQSPHINCYSWSWFHRDTWRHRVVRLVLVVNRERGNWNSNCPSSPNKLVFSWIRDDSENKSVSWWTVYFLSLCSLPAAAFNIRFRINIQINLKHIV